MPARLGLPRERRLLHTRDFRRLRETGARLVQGCLLLNWSPAPSGKSRLGVVTSRKVGGAVVRNRGRRVLRDIFRRHQHEITPPADLVIVARPSLAARKHAEIEADFLRVLHKARLLPSA